MAFRSPSSPSFPQNNMQSPALNARCIGDKGASQVSRLNDLDWKLLLKDARPINDELQMKLDRVTEKIAETEKLRRRYLRVIEGDDEPDDSLIHKYKEAGKTLKELASQKQVLDNRLGQIPALNLSKIPVLELTSEQEYHLILRDEIRKRVERIELTFNAEVIGGEQVGITPGAGKLLVKVLFVNGAVKWAVIEGNRAVLLTLGESSRR
jgi:hypothetical protein